MSRIVVVQVLAAIGAVGDRAPRSDSRGRRDDDLVCRRIHWNGSTVDGRAASRPAARASRDSDVPKVAVPAAVDERASGQVIASGVNVMRVGSASCTCFRAIDNIARSGDILDVADVNVA